MQRAFRHQPIEPVTMLTRHPWSLVILLCVAQFMVIIDATVVNVALPSIGRTLRFSSAADLQWVVTAYVLVTAGLTLLGGRMADLLDRRRIFMVGLLLFTSASLASGLAPSSGALIVSRAAQGLGAALLTPAALSIITTTYTGRQRTAALAVWGGLGAGGAAVGVVLGGVLTSSFGWQWVFFINVPIGVGAAAIALWLVPAAAPTVRRQRDLDIAGALVLIAGMVTLVLTIEAAATHGWGSARALGALILSAGLLTTFAVVERRVRQPLILPATWRVRSLIAGVAMMMGASGVMGGAFFLSSLYLQRVLGAAAWEAGLAFLPLALAVTLAGYVGSRLMSFAGTRSVLILGLVIQGGGALWLSHVPAHASYIANILPGFVAIGIGLGFAFVAVPITVMARVGRDDAGLASGLMQTAHEVGISLGVAVVSAAATARAAQAGFAAGYRQGLLVAAVIAAAAVVAAVIVVPTDRPVATGGRGPNGGRA